MSTPTLVPTKTGYIVVQDDLVKTFDTRDYISRKDCLFDAVGYLERKRIEQLRVDDMADTHP